MPNTLTKITPLHSVVIASLHWPQQFITITTAHPWEVSCGALVPCILLQGLVIPVLQRYFYLQSYYSNCINYFKYKAFAFYLCLSYEDD